MYITLTLAFQGKKSRIVLNTDHIVAITAHEPTIHFPEAQAEVIVVGQDVSGYVVEETVDCILMMLPEG